MSNGDDDKYRSRKWILAVWTEIANTAGTILMEGIALLLIWKTKLPPDVYATFAISIGYVWLFATFGVLGGYGFANVMEKWSLKP